MSLPYELLSVDQIAAWLRSFRVSGQSGKKRDGITLSALANHTGVSMGSLNWIAYGGAEMGIERQRMFSRLHAQIENGQLEAYYDPISFKKKLRPVEKPKPVVRYAADFTGAAPKLKTVERVKPLDAMPAFGSLLTKK